MPDREVQILVFANLEERHLALIREVDPRISVTAVDRQRGIELAPSAEIMVGWNVPEDAVRHASRLRWIQSTGAGVDRLLFPEVTSSEIILTTSSGIHTGVVEHVFAVMLAFTRRLHLALRDQLQRKWDRSRTSGDELRGKTLGILGLGTIGAEIAHNAQVFGMRVIGMRRTAGPVPGVDLVVGSDGLSTVLRESDVVVVALPLTPQTHGLIGEDAFRTMKRSALFINIGRGPIVQEQALVAALRDDRIAGAALDVFEREPLPADSPLYGFENIIITPHVSGTSPAYMDRAVPLFCENLRRYLQGERLQNVVDKELGY
jgi:D-2-hydroxyacid dehydrogenase (NADP+)